MAPYGQRLRLAFKLFIPFLATSILYSLIVVLWFLPMFVLFVLFGAFGAAFPGLMSNIGFLFVFVLLALLSLAPGIVYAFRRCLFGQVVVLEGRVAFKALSRARELIRIPAGPGFWNKGETRAAIFFLVLLIVGLSSFAVTVVPKMILAAKYGSQFQNQPAGAIPLDQFAQFAIPPSWMVLLHLVDAVVYAFLLPISIICFVIFYYEQRIRGEGFGAPPEPEPATDEIELADGAVEPGPA